MFSGFILIFFILLVTKDKQNKHQKRKKRQNIRDLRNRRKVKDIAKDRKDIEEKIIKNHSDALNISNRMGAEDQILAISYPSLPTTYPDLHNNKN